MVRSAAQLIRRKGVTGTGMREVVAHAAAPRGSLQHYFPGGKDQLVTEALLFMGDVAGRRARRAMEAAGDAGPGTLLAELVAAWRKEFLAVGFDAGCPLVAAAADVAADSDGLRATIARAFTGWQQPLQEALTRSGVPPGRAPALATLVISALEGAIVLARVHRDVAPLDVLDAELGPLLDASVD